MKEGILGIKEVADYLKMRQQTVYRLVKQKRIPALSPYRIVDFRRSNRSAPKNIPTRVTIELEIDIIGRKNRCSILPAVWSAATAEGLFKIILNINDPSAMIIIDSDEGIPIARIFFVISKLNERFATDISK